MAETEVENILREIRERVISQQRSGQDGAATSARPVTTNGANGGNDSGMAGYEHRQNSVSENLALIDSYLATTGRAWDRLPPVVSYRSGFVARIELWLKRHLKAGTRWFAWEQVNFNSAVHHALRDLLPVLSAHEQELRQLQATIEAQFEQHAPRAEMNARLAELVSELRDRDERLQDQQRVSFKQLSLEASEAAVLEDRARRKTETLLEELRRRVEQLEARK